MTGLTPTGLLRFGRSFQALVRTVGMSFSPLGIVHPLSPSWEILAAWHGGISIAGSRVWSPVDGSSDHSMH